jgi:hypothetical protein
MWIAGLLSALGLLFLIFKFGIRRVVSYDIPIDVAVTGFLMWAFAGTYSGMMAAMIGGLVVSVVLYVLKRTIVREVLVFETRNVQIAKKLSVPVPTYQWVTVNPA